MMKRYQQILAIALVVQLVLVGVVFWPRSAAPVVSAPLFPGLKAEDIKALTVTGQSGQSLRVLRAETGWVLPDFGDYPVLDTKVTPLLDTLVGLNSARLIVRSESSHSQLQVADDTFAVKMELTLASGVTNTLYVGTAPNYGSAHVRVGGQNEVYLVDGVSSYDLSPEPAGWIDPAWLSFAAESVRQVTIENAAGRLVMIRDQDSWKLPAADLGQIPDVGKITELVNRLSALSIVAPLGQAVQPEYGMDKPQVVVTVELADKTITLQVGAQDLDGFVAHSSESPYYVRVSSYTVEDLLQTTVADWVTQPEPTLEAPTVPTDTLPLSPTLETPVTGTESLTETEPLTGTETITP